MGLPQEFADLAPIIPPAASSSGPNAGDYDNINDVNPSIRIHTPTLEDAFHAKATVVHELAHAMEDGMSQDQWDEFLQIRNRTPPSNRQPVTDESRYHKLTPYFDDYHQLGTPIPSQLVEFLNRISPSLIKIASERQKWMR